MPTPPDSRVWLTSAQIAQRLFAWVRTTHPEIIDCLGTLEKQEAFILSLREAFEATGYGREFKIIRLTEKLKDRIEEGAFGDTNRSPLKEVLQTFRDIYREGVLAAYDEEGNRVGSKLPASPGMRRIERGERKRWRT